MATKLHSGPASRPESSAAPADKLARQRLSVIDLAETLGNVSEACRRSGMSREMFYEWRRRFQTQGLAGLKDLPPIPKNHPMTTPPEVVDKIVVLALDHPAWGCNRLAAHLKLDGISLSAPTVQSILVKHDLGTRQDRWLALERRNADQPIVLSAEQVKFIEAENPQFAERHVESSRPGELLCQDVFYVGRLKGVGRVYLHSVVDTYGSYAFGFLHTTKTPEAAATVLVNDVLPFYEDQGLPVTSILTDNGKEFCGTETHPYELLLSLADIEHRTTKVKHPWTNGFVERFHRTVLDEFFRQVFRTTYYESVEVLQVDLDRWMVEYNTERPHLGYRNNGKRPRDTIDNYLANSSPALTVNREG